MRTSYARLVLVLALPAAPPAVGAPCPTRFSWPTADWPSRRDEVAAARPAAVNSLGDYAFTLTGADAERNGIRTDGVLVIHKGAVVYERYGRGWGPDNRHLAWSVSKSFTSALTGVAVARGAMSLEDSICKWVSSSREANCRIKIKHLLEWGSGLDWKEIYEDQSNQASSVLALLYGEGHHDMATFTVDHAPRDDPGTSYQYSTGETTLLMAAVTRALTAVDGEAFPWTLFFDRLGMKRTAFERDARGAFVGGSFVYATPRDFARFGYLYLNDGCWEGARVLPEGWVAFSTTVNDVIGRKRVEWDGGVLPGQLWWLNQVLPGVQDTLPWPDVPADAFAALGHWGQSITVMPSLDLVVVRVADDRDESFDLNRLLALAIALVK